MQRPLIFIHIPKTAGATFSSILKQKYRPEETFSCGAESYYTEFFSLSAIQRNKLRLLHGHMPYGFHEKLESPVHYVTFLRNPIERVISFYYFLVDLPDPNNYLYELVSKPQMSFEDFLANKVTIELDNLQTRLLAGEASFKLKFGECTEATLQQALENLHKMDVIGLTERFDESLLWASKVLGWRFLPVYRASKNKNDSRPERVELPTHIVSTIKAYNQLDIRLYEAAKILIDEKLREVNISAEKLATFGRINKVYQYMVRVPDKIKYMIRG